MTYDPATDWGILVRMSGATRRTRPDVTPWGYGDPFVQLPDEEDADPRPPRIIWRHGKPTAEDDDDPGPESGRPIVDGEPGDLLINLDGGEDETLYVYDSVGGYTGAPPTPQYARPDSDEENGVLGPAWTTEPLWSKIDEEDPSDVDYITCTLAAFPISALKLGLTTITDPTTDEGHVLSLRMRVTAGAIAASGVSISRSDTGVALVTSDDDWFIDEITDTWSTITWELTAEEAANLDTHYGRLGLYFYINADENPTTIQLSHAVLQVPGV
jgi:hypothetical protein